MEKAQLEHHLEEIEHDGYTVLEGAIDPEFNAAILKRVHEIEKDTLEGLAPGASEADSSFLRTGGLLRLDPLFWDVPTHPEALAVIEGVLGADCLLSTMSAIDVKPRSKNVQPIHPDDARHRLVRPHPAPIGATALWIITDFNSGTGGTRLIPGSHRTPDAEIDWARSIDGTVGAIQPDVPGGSILVFDHALLHGTSDNPSDEWRLGLQISYHVGWVRPYTNWFRTIPIEEVAEYPQKLADLLGYKTYMGIGSANPIPGTYREVYKGMQPQVRLPLS